MACLLSPARQIYPGACGVQPSLPFPNPSPPHSLPLPRLVQRGVTLRGLRHLEGRVKQLCAEGTFKESREIDGKVYEGTDEYQSLTTKQLVDIWIRDDKVTGDRRLADCTDLFEPRDIGVPTYFVRCERQRA